MDVVKAANWSTDCDSLVTVNFVRIDNIIPKARLPSIGVATSVKSVHGFTFKIFGLFTSAIKL